MYLFENMAAPKFVRTCLFQNLTRTSRNQKRFSRRLPQTNSWPTPVKWVILFNGAGMASYSLSCPSGIFKCVQRLHRWTPPNIIFIPPEADCIFCSAKSAGQNVCARLRVSAANSFPKVYPPQYDKKYSAIKDTNYKTKEQNETKL